MGGRLFRFLRFDRCSQAASAFANGPPDRDTNDQNWFGSMVNSKSERRFRDDRTKATRSHKPDDGDDRVNENDEDVVHAGIVLKSQKIPEFSRFCNSPPTGELTYH